ASRDGEHRLSFQVRIKQLEDVSLTRSCRRLHHHVFSLLQRAHCLLLPQIGNNQPRPKPWSHSWKMFAVWSACNRDRDLADEPHGYSAVLVVARRGDAGGIEIGYHDVVTAEIWGAHAACVLVSAPRRNGLRISV